MRNQRIDFLLNSLIRSFDSQPLPLPKEKLQTIKNEAARLFDSQWNLGDIDYDILVKQRFKSAKNKDTLLNTVRRLPGTQKFSSVLYILTCLSNEQPDNEIAAHFNLKLSGKKDFCAASSSNPLRFKNYNEMRLAKDFSKIIFEEQQTGLFYLNFDKKGNLHLPKNIVAEDKVFRLLEKTNVLLFFRSQIRNFTDEKSAWPGLQDAKTLFAQKTDLTKLGKFKKTLSLMNIDCFIEQQMQLFEAVALLAFDLSHCSSENLFFNFLLKLYYLRSAGISRNLAFELLTKAESRFQERLVDLLKGLSTSGYYKVINGPKNSVFPKIEIFDEELPFKIIDKILLTKLFQIREIRLVLAKIQDSNASDLSELNITSLSVCKEESILLFKERIEGFYHKIQEQFINCLLSKESIFQQLELFKEIALGSNATFMENLLNEIAKIEFDQMTRINLLQALEGVLIGMGKQFAPFIYSFDLLGFEPMPGESVAHNFFLYYHFSQICGIFFDKTFQDNAMRFFNLNLKLRDFRSKMHKFFSSPITKKSIRMRQLYFFLDKFYRDLMFYIFHHVVEERFRSLLTTIKQSKKIDGLYLAIKDFSCKIIDSCFLSHESFCQRKIFRLLEMLQGRFSLFFEREDASDKECFLAMKGFKKIFKEMVGTLAQLESQNPDCDYAKLRVMLEFNNFFQLN